MLAGRHLRRADLLSIVEQARQGQGGQQPGQGVWDLLYQAHLVRRANFGRGVKLCSIVPGKLGNCSEDCKWCAQSSHSVSGALQPGRATIDEICRAAAEARESGAANIGIVNSGRKPSTRDINEVIAAAERIAEENGGKIGVCVSLGETSDNQFKKLSASSITRYHHNLETSRRFFPNMVTSHTYDDKLRTLRSARQAGLSICCGGLFGLGETWEDRIDLAIAIRNDIQPDVVPLNFLVPIPGTPLAAIEPMSPMEILQVIAVFRLVLPRVDLKVAAGRETNLRDLQSWIFLAGATSFMVGKYLTTAGQAIERDLKMLDDLGLAIVSEFKSEFKQDTSHSKNTKHYQS